MKTVDVNVVESTASITLNRQESGNAINMALAQELAECASMVSADDAITSVILTGAGRMFCSGGDISAFAAAKDNASQFVKELADTLHGAIMTFATMAKPLIVLVNGPAAGAGLSLVLAGDIAIAARSAHFTAAYTAIGLTPDGGMSWLLPRAVGWPRARSMMLTNRRVSAEEAVQFGLVSETVDDHDLADAGTRIIKRLATISSPALAGTKRLITAASGATFINHLEQEAQSIAAASDTQDARRALESFLSKSSF